MKGRLRFNAVDEQDDHVMRSRIGVEMDPVMKRLLDAGEYATAAQQGLDDPTPGYEIDRPSPR